jgi:uncharacterized membrane protein YqjE
MGDFDAPGRPPGGLFDSLRTLIATLVAMAHTRVELFGNELEEELERIVGLVVGAVIVIAASGLALLFCGLAIVAAFWDTHRVAAALFVAIGFGVLAVVAYFSVRLRAQRHTRLLSATLGELEQDRQQLGRPAP